MLANEPIVDQLQKQLTRGNPCVMATVVTVEGSAYRREGSKMLIHQDGSFEGMISGGCLEADVVEEALKVLEQQEPLLKKYVLDEDLVWGLGLGCPGIVEVLIEPINPESFIWKKWVEAYQKPLVLCKLVKPKEVTNLLVTTTDVVGKWNNPVLQQEATAIARKRVKEKNPRSRFEMMSDGVTEIFLDIALPPAHICILGAGHDAIPVAQIAHQLGFRTTVVDGRPAFNTKERFPHAERIIMQPQDLMRTNLISANTFIIIMNHHLERDMSSLAFALRSDAPYVGVLGPRKRRDKMLASLEDSNISFSRKEMDKMHNPIGLDIGAVTPEEIALSIMAEIVALQKGHKGSFLKDSYFIHHHRVLEEQL